MFAALLSSAYSEMTNDLTVHYRHIFGPRGNVGVMLLDVWKRFLLQIAICVSTVTLIKF